MLAKDYQPETSAAAGKRVPARTAALSALHADVMCGALLGPGLRMGARGDRAVEDAAGQLVVLHLAQVFGDFLIVGGKQ